MAKHFDYVTLILKMNVHDEEASVNFANRREEIMAERSAASTWKTKRRQQDKCCSNARHGSSSSKPTPSGSLAPVHPDPDPSEASSDDEGGIHSESKKERGASGSSSGEDVSISIPRKLEAFLMTGSL